MGCVFWLIRAVFCFIPVNVPVDFGQCGSFVSDIGYVLKPRPGVQGCREFNRIAEGKLLVAVYGENGKIKKFS